MCKEQGIQQIVDAYSSKVAWNTLVKYYGGDANVNKVQL